MLFFFFFDKEFPGNVRLSETIERYYDRYKASKRGVKADICMELILKVRSENGRFLKRNESGNEWIEVADDEAKAKVGQAFRNLFKKQTENARSAASSEGEDEDGMIFESKRVRLLDDLY